MIFIVFISLTVTYFFIQYFENRRRQRNEEQRKRRQEAFNKLLNTIKEKENSVEQDKNKYYEP